MSAIITPNQINAEACQKEMNAVLAKYGLKMDPYCVITLAGMQLGINLTPIGQQANVAPKES